MTMPSQPARGIHSDVDHDTLPFWCRSARSGIVLPAPVNLPLTSNESV